MKTKYSLIAVLLLYYALINSTFAQPLTADAGTDTLICTGQTIQMGGTPTATGGQGPYAYLWMPTLFITGGGGINPYPIATPQTTTTYTLYVSDALGSTASDCVTVTTTPNPDFVMDPDSLILHHYFIINNTTGIAPLAYLWSWGDGTTDTIAYPSHTYSTAGYYNVCLTVTDSLGCSYTFCDSSYLQKTPKFIISVDVIPPVIADINKIVSACQVSIYPNPTKGSLIIEFPQQAFIEILDVSGQTIQTIYNFNKTTTADLTNLSSGIYIVRVKSDKTIVTRKIIKE